MACAAPSTLLPHLLAASPNAERCVSVSIAANTAGALCSGSPMPMNTMLVMGGGGEEGEEGEREGEGEEAVGPGVEEGEVAEGKGRGSEGGPGSGSASSSCCAISTWGRLAVGGL